MDQLCLLLRFGDQYLIYNMDDAIARQYVRFNDTDVTDKQTLIIDRDFQRRINI
jgi:hypothetical protein